MPVVRVGVGRAGRVGDAGLIAAPQLPPPHLPPPSAGACPHTPSDPAQADS